LNERERHVGIDITLCEGYEILVPTCPNPKFFFKAMCLELLGHYMSHFGKEFLKGSTLN